MSLLRIGAFARVAGATIKTLRFYDEEGLLRPAHIDARTGYRYYDLSQITQLRLLRRLRALDFSIEEMRGLVTRGADSARLPSALAVRRKAIETQLNAARSQLAHIEHWMCELDGGRIASPPSPSLRLERGGPVAMLRVPVVGGAGAAELLDECARVTRWARPSAPPIAIWHGCPSRSESVECEVRVPIHDSVRSRGGFSVSMMPDELLATVVHVAADGPIGEMYVKLRAWISRQELTVTGRVREVYWRGGVATNDEADVTEIQFPVSESVPREVAG